MAERLPLVVSTGGLAEELPATDSVPLPDLTNDKFWVGDSSDDAAEQSVTDFALTLLDDATALAARTTLGVQPAVISIACSDEDTDLATGTAVVTFRTSFAMTLTEVRSSVTTAPTGSALTVDINEGVASILSTKLTIDATEKTSETAATAAVISDTTLADDAEMTIDIDAVGSTTPGKGLKVYLIGYKT